MKMGHVRMVIEIKARPEQVFAHIDNIRNMVPHVGAFGGKLDLEIVSKNASGVGATYHWRGRLLGWKVDLTEIVTKWVMNKEKAYRGIKGFKFDVHWILSSKNDKTEVNVEFSYELPGSYLGKLIDRLFINRYVERGFRKVLHEMKDILERENSGNMISLG